MIKFVIGPTWFSGYDIIFDIVSVVVTALIMFSFYKIYKFTKDSKYLLFSLSFFLIALSEFAKVFRNFQVYYDILQSKTIGTITISYVTIHKSSFLIFFGNFFHRLFLLLGLLGIFYTYNRTENKMPYYLIIYFIVLTALISTEYYYLFHLTATIFLLFVLRHAILNYQQKKNKTSLSIATAFGLLFLSRIFFTFVELNNINYVIAELLQLAGFLTMLSIYLYTKKKWQEEIELT